MTEGYVTLKVRIKSHEKNLLIALAKASNYTAANGRPDLGRVIGDLLESEVERATWPKHRASQEGYASLQEAVEDQVWQKRRERLKERVLARRRRREAMATLKRIK